MIDSADTCAIILLSNEHMNIRSYIKKRRITMKKSYKIDVDCAACAEKMEVAAKETEGVKDATVSYMTLKMKVEFEDGADVDTVMKNVRENCKKVEDDCEVFI